MSRHGWLRVWRGFWARVAVCSKGLSGTRSEIDDAYTDGQNDLLIVSTLDLLHGVLLVHPPSRSLFAREIYMNVRFIPQALPNRDPG